MSGRVEHPSVEERIGKGQDAVVERGHRTGARNETPSGRLGRRGRIFRELQVEPLIGAVAGDGDVRARQRLQRERFRRDHAELGEVDRCLAHRLLATKVDRIQVKEGIDVTEGAHGAIERMIFDASRCDQQPAGDRTRGKRPQGAVLHDANGRLRCGRAGSVELLDDQSMIEHTIDDEPIADALDADRTDADRDLAPPGQRGRKEHLVRPGR